MGQRYGAGGMAFAAEALEGSRGVGVGHYFARFCAPCVCVDMYVPVWSTLVPSMAVRGGKFGLIPDPL